MPKIISTFHFRTDTLFVGKMYSFLSAGLDTNTCFWRWKSDFVALRGHLDTQRRLNVGSLNDLFNLHLVHDKDIFCFIFCLETYYTLVLRQLAYRSVFKQDVLDDVFWETDCFKQKNIQNYICPDVYDWVIKMPDFQTNIQKTWEATAFSPDDLQTDIIKPIFEAIFPTPVRHSMGEFYTPDWLANFVIETVTNGDADAHTKTYLDPSCGSGTFLFNTLRKFKSASENRIFQQVYGIDINPVSVLAAKTNYLLLYALEHNIDQIDSLSIPIFHADTIRANAATTSLFESEEHLFEQITAPQVDYIVGNPPWVNWEYLPKDYRQKTAFLWQHYNLFAQKGMDAGFIKEDISVLLTYVAIDKYLKNGGKLGFVVKETLFKSVKQGEGFRKFKIYPTGTPLNPYRVDDLTSIKPFKDATTRTALLFIEKGKPVQYPVDFVQWQPLNGKRKLENDFDTQELSKYFGFLWKKAKPSDANLPNSGWITTESKDVEKTDFALGISAYTARTGTFTGGANGIFWLHILGKKGGDVLVKNITERAKNKMPQVEMPLETEFVFPFLTGNDLDFWEYRCSKYILCPHTPESKMYPVAATELQKLPKTWAYLDAFRQELRDRKGFTSFDKHIQLQSFYAIQRIGAYTFAPYKVAWRYISSQFTPAVVEYADDSFLGRKNIIPNEKIIFVGLNDRQEAYFLCGVLSSTLYRQTIQSFMVNTQITPSLISRLNLPKFNPANLVHLQISQWCEKGHFQEDKTFFVKQIDDLVDELLMTNIPVLSLP